MTLLPLGQWLLIAGLTIWGYLATARRAARRYERQINAEWLTHNTRR